MPERVIEFKDLSRLARPTRKGEDVWLAELAGESNRLAELTVHLGGTAPKRIEGEESPAPLLTRDLDGTWRAGRFIGEIRRGERMLRVRPRLQMSTIAHWANAALELRVFEESAAKGGLGFLLAELQGAMWKRALLRASRHGPMGTRIPVSHVGTSVRGRLDVGSTVALMAAGERRLASVSMPRSFDNSVTRAIIAAGRVLDRDIPRPDWKGREVERLLAHMRAETGTRPVVPSRNDLRRVRYTPITQGYRSVAELSWRIATRNTLGSSATAGDIDGVLLDVAELWELFVLHCARVAAGGLQVDHGTRESAHPLLHSVNDESFSMGNLYPDLLVRDNGDVRLVIDAKYKRLDEWNGVAREDLYQLTAYLLAHAGEYPVTGALAYPAASVGENKPLSRAESRGPWRYAGSTRQPVTAHFCRLPTNETACIEFLAALISESMTS